MKKQVYSVHDGKAEVYNLPFYKGTHGEAERDFTELVNDERSMVSKYPEDFDLYHLGSFDDLTGVHEPLATPRHVIKAVSCIRKDGAKWQPKPITDIVDA